MGRSVTGWGVGTAVGVVILAAGWKIGLGFVFNLIISLGVGVASGRLATRRRA
jgi:hypothetical protein